MNNRKTALLASDDRGAQGASLRLSDATIDLALAMERGRQLRSDCLAIWLGGLGAQLGREAGRLMRRLRQVDLFGRAAGRRPDLRHRSRACRT